MQPFFPWKTINYYIFSERVFSVSFPGCNAHAPYFRLWPLRLHNIFPRYFKITEY